MVGKVIVSHGGLATELLRAAEKIAGPLKGFVALSPDWRQGQEQVRLDIAAAIEKVDEGDGVLILADMFGDTPCNAALSLLEPGRVELISGINLPLVVRLACQGSEHDKALEEVARWARDKGLSSIRLGSEMTSASGTGCDRGGSGTKTEQGGG